MRKAKLKQVYYHFAKLEEFEAGLWRKLTGEAREIMLQKAIEFTGNAELYGTFMKKVVSEWPYSCEQNLTCESMNRQAWIGHAAACLAINSPEEITRLAWHHLTLEQQEREILKLMKLSPCGNITI